MKIYHYLLGANARESAPESQLPDLVLAGTIRPETLVWTDGMSGWAPAGQVLPQLFARTAAAPPPVSLQPRPAQKSHVIDFEILGDDMQMVEIELDPGETVIAEAGAMCFMEEGIEFETKMGDGSTASTGFFGAIKAIGKRMLTGESLFMTHFTHKGTGKKKVCFAGPYPGKIVPLDLSDLGGEILCEKGAFLCAAMGTTIGIAFTKKLGVGFFGGEGFILQKINGDGLAFIHAGGTVVRRELKGQTLRVDTGCIVAMTSGVNYDIQKAGNLKSMVFGGEGLFLATLSGQGSVWLQSLPFSRMADRIISSAPSAGGSAKGEGSVLGGLGRMIGGNDD